MVYQASTTRYQTMAYRRCGSSGLQLPAISLGLWHNFGDETRVETSRRLISALPISTWPIIMGRRRARRRAILAASLKRPSCPIAMS